MDFELTADQVDLKDGVRKLCEGRFPIEVVRDAEALPGAVDRGRWQELADAGVFALRIPEGAEGVGLGMAEGVLVFEELGRALVPGPLVATEVAAQLLPTAAWGAEVVGVVERAAAPAVVEHLDALDRLLVLDDGGVWSLARDEVEGKLLDRPIDPLTPMSSVATLAAGERVGDAAAAARLRVEGAILTAAFLVGSAQAVTDLAVRYAKEREQFNRPIGSFQAVKHILADMQTRASVAQAAVYAAGVTLDDPVVGDPGRAASAAKLVAGDAAVRNAKGAIQVHGGMGFTWEVDAHLHLKRSWVLDTQFGSADHHADRLAGLL